MLSFVFRIILYTLMFAAIWYGGQFYVSYKLSKWLLEPTPNTVFVDKKVLANSIVPNQSGSYTYPFGTIQNALDSVKEKSVTTIIIAPGIYEEELKLPENTVLYSTGDVSIKQKHDPFINTLTTNNGTSIINIDISGGNNAVVIPNNTSTRFINTTMSDAMDFGVKMEKKERPETPEDQEELIVYEFFGKTDSKINSAPLVKFSNVTVTKNKNQGMYLRDGRVEILNSKIIENGEEGIDLHSHMHVIIENTNASNNGESGFETEIYDNIVLIKNSNFNNNTKNGLAFITSHGIGDIQITNSTISNNKKFGIRCAVHKNKPKKPRPFFQSLITEEDNIMGNNTEGDIAERCMTF